MCLKDRERKRERESEKEWIACVRELNKSWNVEINLDINCIVTNVYKCSSRDPNILCVAEHCPTCLHPKSSFFQSLSSPLLVPMILEWMWLSNQQTPQVKSRMRPESLALVAIFTLGSARHFAALWTSYPTTTAQLGTASGPINVHVIFLGQAPLQPPQPQQQQLLLLQPPPPLLQLQILAENLDPTKSIFM